MSAVDATAKKHLSGHGLNGGPPCGAAQVPSSSQFIGEGAATLSAGAGTHLVTSSRHARAQVPVDAA
jgi:hypothetical protein